MGKKNKAPEAKCGDKPCTSKCKIQQSAPLASAVSTTEMANKPKAVAAEATPSPPPPPAEVAKGAEDDRKIAVQPKYVAKPRVAITGATSVEPVAGEKEEHVEESSLKASAPLLVKKADYVEEGKEGGDGQADQVEDDEDDDDNDDDDDDEVKDEDLNGNDGSDYAPDEDSSEGIVNLDDDAVAADNLQGKVKPGQKVSSPFDLLILPIARTLLVKKGEKGNKVHDGNDESILLLSNEEAPLKKKKGKLATKLPTAGSSSKVGSSENSSKDVLMMIKGIWDEFFNLPWKKLCKCFGFVYVSVFVIVCVMVYVNCSLNVFVSLFNVDYVNFSLNIFVSVFNVVYNLPV